MIPSNLKILINILSYLTFLKILPSICVHLDMLFCVGLKGAEDLGCFMSFTFSNFVFGLRVLTEQDVA